MSTRSKGNRRERQVVQTLNFAGWEVHKKVNNTYDSSDIFGLFDVIAVRDDEKPLFIQVKSNRTSGALKQIRVAPFINPETMNIQVWIAHDNQGFRVKKLEDESWTQIIDEREKNCDFGDATVELFSK